MGSTGEENVPFPENQPGRDEQVRVQWFRRRDPMAKKSASENKAAKGTGKPRKGKGKTQRNFPSVTLEEALKVPQAIRQQNHGHPWDTNLVAKACGLSRQNKCTIITTAATCQPSSTSAMPSNTSSKSYRSTAQEFTDIFKANCKYLDIENGLQGVPATGENGSAAAINIRVLGQPQGQFDKTAFVIMPFSEKGKQVRSTGFFDEVLRSLITPSRQCCRIRGKDCQKRG